MKVNFNQEWDKELNDYIIQDVDITNIPVETMLILIKALKTFSEDFNNAEDDRLDAINFCEAVRNKFKNDEGVKPESEDE